MSEYILPHSDRAVSLSPIVTIDRWKGVMVGGSLAPVDSVDYKAEYSGSYDPDITPANKSDYSTLRAAYLTSPDRKTWEGRLTYSSPNHAEALHSNLLLVTAGPYLRMGNDHDKFYSGIGLNVGFRFYFIRPNPAKDIYFFSGAEAQVQGGLLVDARTSRDTEVSFDAAVVNLLFGAVAF